MGDRRKRGLAGSLALLGPLGILLWVYAVPHAVPSGPAAAPIYTVGEILVTLQDRSGEMVGRAIRVRADAWPCPAWPEVRCPVPEPVLVDSGACSTLAWLPLAPQRPGRLWVLARRAPLLGRMLPALQAPVWGKSMTYRVRIEPVAAACQLDLCYRALLLDTAPGSL